MTRSHMLLFWMTTFTCLVGCTSLFGETSAQQFKKAKKQISKRCAERAGDSACVFLDVKPADPFATPEGLFAHSIKIPNPVSLVGGYKPGMTSQEYFDLLCETEAGEFIDKTVETVEGIYKMRPRARANHEYGHLYAFEDPYGWESDTFKFSLISHGYDYFEVSLPTDPEPPSMRQYYHVSMYQPPDADARYVRYFGYDGKKLQTGQRSFHKERKSRFGYTWRGVLRPHDRERVLPHFHGRLS